MALVALGGYGVSAIEMDSQQRILSAEREVVVGYHAPDQPFGQLVQKGGTSGTPCPRFPQMNDTEALMIKQRYDARSLAGNEL
jgi:hypothetical protein